MSASHPSHQQARKTGSRPVSHPVGRSVSCGNSIVWDYLEHVMYVFTPRSPRLPLLCVIVSPPECLSIGVWLTLFTFSSESVRLCALNVWTLRAENYSASALVHPCVCVSHWSADSFIKLSKCVTTEECLEAAVWSCFIVFLNENKPHQQHTDLTSRCFMCVSQNKTDSV